MLFQVNFAVSVAVRRQQQADTGGMLLRALENAVMPLRCVFCGIRTVHPKRHICSGCDADLPRIASPPPPVSSPLERDIAPLAYEFPVDAAIKALKFRRRLYYGPALAELLCGECERLPDSVDAVLPVPLHWRRRWFRGFNQADEIAGPVAQNLGVPLLRNVTRVRATPYQSGLGAQERIRNLRGAFAVHGALSAHHVLIVDDVITTGATVRQLARVLRRAGASKVSAIAVARA
jgi:ComF family protein